MKKQFLADFWILLVYKINYLKSDTKIDTIIQNLISTAEKMIYSLSL